MILRALWNRAMAKLGQFATFLPAIGRQIKTAIEEGDAAKVTSRTAELREAATVQIELCDKLDAVVADGVIDAVEATETLAVLDRWLDEIEDVGKGYDEDDPKPATP